MLFMQKESGEYKAAFDILTLFREAYQQTGNAIGGLNQLFENARGKVFKEYPYEDFAEFIAVSAKENRAFAEENQNGADFCKKLQEKVSRGIIRIRCGGTVRFV